MPSGDRVAASLPSNLQLQLPHACHSRPGSSRTRLCWRRLRKPHGARSSMRSHIQDGERVGWVMEGRKLRRGMSERYAVIVYQVHPLILIPTKLRLFLVPQTLVSGILLRPHGTETDTTMPSQSSPIHPQVEAACVDLLRWIRKRWMEVRQEGGFDAQRNLARCNLFLKLDPLRVH